ncbi:MAG: GTP-binding protein [Beijerinckiaceae bacterium]|nr:GTP-binding protein [Beijerinckiaceae bacterium]
MTPVSIITGFLGSGKTTLLRRLLAHPDMGETAVLVNELGEVGLDHILLRKVDEDIILLNSGCLCCTVRDDLVETLEELRAKRADGTIPPFKRVVIETTGLADPAPILHTLMIDKALTRHYRLLGLVTTVDSTHGGQQLDDHREAVKQTAMADRIVLTKSDLAIGVTRDALRRRLVLLNPSATLFTASVDSGPSPNELFDAGFEARDKTADVRAWLEEEEHHDSHTHHDHHHAPSPPRHDDLVSSFCLFRETPLDWEVFAEWLELLLVNRGKQILRIKGILNRDGHAKPLVVHGVQHVFYPPVEWPIWPDTDRRSKIVFITHDLPRSAVEKSFHAWMDGGAT